MPAPLPAGYINKMMQTHRDPYSPFTGGAIWMERWPMSSRLGNSFTIVFIFLERDPDQTLLRCRFTE
jgi:hypothetical protein